MSSSSQRLRKSIDRHHIPTLIPQLSDERFEKIMEATKRRTVKSLIAKLNSESEAVCIESMCELRLLTKKDDSIRPVIAEANAVPLIAESLYSPIKILQENAVATLLNLSISCKEHLMMPSSRVLDALSHLLSTHPVSAFSAQCAAAAIFSLSAVESYRPIIGHRRDITFGLLEIVRNRSSTARTIQESLKALFGIALYPLNRAQMVELGAIHALLELTVENRGVALVEDATAVIAQVAGCEESWEEFKKSSSVEVVVDLLGCSAKSSLKTKENAVSVLCNLGNCGGEEAVASMRSEVRSIAIDGIEEVVGNGSEKGKSKALALLKMVDPSGNGRLRRHCS